MASQTIQGGATFPESTSVGAYLRSQWGVEGLTGAPTGAAVETKTVTGGQLAFVSLADNTEYVAYAQVGGQDRYRRFTTYTASSPGGALSDLAVTPRLMSDLARTGGWLPTGAIAETIHGRAVNSNVVPTTGQLYVAGGIVIPGGRAVSSITFMSDTAAAVTPLNQWFCLLDTSRNVLATTVDDTTTAWGANVAKTLQIATAIGGGTSGGSYTPANAIEVYVGINVVATTLPNIKAIATTTPLSGLAPKMGGTIGAASAFTGPISTNPGAITETTRLLYAYVS